MRPFTPESFWNTPLGDAPVDRASRRFLRWLKGYNRLPHLVLAVGDWAMPVYRPDWDDPLVRIEPYSDGPTCTFRLPAGAEPMQGQDGAIVVLDETTDVVVSLHRFEPATMKAAGTSRYGLSTEGLDERVGGSVGNWGHRGIPGTAMCVLRDELTTGIERRLKISIPGTAEWHRFPMVNHENDRGGIIGEGIILRLRPDRSLSGLSPGAKKIAQALQDYGAVVGDNGGVAALKMEVGTIGVDPWGLEKFTWSDYEFVERNWAADRFMA